MAVSGTREAQKQATDNGLESIDQPHLVNSADVSSAVGSVARDGKRRQTDSYGQYNPKT